MCRHPCYTLVKPKPNVLLTAILREAFPDHAAPPKVAEDKLESETRLFPIFLSTSVQLPDTTCSMHLFEPRYRRLSEMALDNGGDFVIVWARGARGFPLMVDPASLVCSAACIVHIDESHQSPDGRFYFHCRGTVPVRIQECWVEESSGDLFMARCLMLEESLDSSENDHQPANASVDSEADLPVDAAVAAVGHGSEARSAHQVHVEYICEKMRILGLAPRVASGLPADVTRFSWQAAAAAAGPMGWIAPEQLQLLLETRNTLHRLALLGKFYSDAEKKRWSVQHWLSAGLSHWRFFLAVVVLAWGLSDVGSLKVWR